MHTAQTASSALALSGSTRIVGSSAGEDGGTSAVIRSSLSVDLRDNATLVLASAKGSGGAVFVRQHPGPVQLALQGNASIANCTAGAEGGFLSTSQALSGSGSNAVTDILAGGSSSSTKSSSSTLGESAERGVTLSLTGSSSISGCKAGERGGALSVALAPLNLTLGDRGESHMC